MGVMALLAATVYDPATAQTASCASLLAMTALDTTNLRLTFTAPANGCVQIRIRVPALDSGSTPYAPFILLGVLESSTVVGRITPVGAGSGLGTNAGTVYTQEALFTVSGLSAGSHTYDAAYAVQFIGGGDIKYGGPNDTAGADAWGGISFEIYDAPNLNSVVLYDPGTAASKSLGSLLAMTALDTTNARITFTPPASGNVFVRIRVNVTSAGSTTMPNILLGVLQSTTVIGRTYPIGGVLANTTVSQPYGVEAAFAVTGLSGSKTWDAAYAVQVAKAADTIRWGGPNNNSGSNAGGALLFEIWNA